MSSVHIAVVGHTNTGKTSLLRTLLRKSDFGEVSTHPGQTRHVERATVTLDGATLELYDTPGLESSIELLEHLEALAADRHVQGADRIERFLKSEAADGAFAQEAKVLRQLLRSDVALYVVDVREPMRAKHRDELTALSWCARPIVPVLNFVKGEAGEPTRVNDWRRELRRVGLHTIVEFDAFVRDLDSERHLLEKLASVLDEHADTLNAVMRARQREHEGLVRGAARLIAELLVDAAAHSMSVRAEDHANQANDATAQLRERVRQREQRCVDALFELFGFDPARYVSDELPIEGGRWGLDLFSPEAAKRFGAWTGGAAATGAAVGLAIDVAAGGLTLGTGTALGTAAGAVLGAGKAHGRRIVGWWRGQTELRCDDATLRLLATRQVALARELLRRGHAALGPVKAMPDGLASFESVPGPLRTARNHPTWSAIGYGERAPANDPHRTEAVKQLAALIEHELVARAKGTRAAIRDASQENEP